MSLVITNPLSNIPKAPKSHNLGYAQIWADQLNAKIDHTCTKNIQNATKLRKLCESKINSKVVGFKAGGTALPVLKKLKEKEPFYSAIFKNNVL